MSLSILSMRSSIAFASCTSWTNFKEDLSTSKKKVVNIVYACAKLRDGPIFFYLQVVHDYLFWGA